MDESKMAFLQSVLRYSTSNTDTTTQEQSAEPLREMSPERKKWLENALTNMSINPVDEIKKCIKFLDEPNELEKQVEALETLKDWCEDINFAIDFHKINRYALIFKLLNHESSEIRALTCDLIGSLAQNNVYCQETLLESKLLPLILQKLDKDTDEVKIKALFAISCLTRDYEPGQEKLLEGNAIDILIKSLQTPVEKLQIKCCFLFSSICNNNKIKNKLTEKRLIETLIGMYRDPNSNIHEHILSAINIIIDDNPNAIKQAKEMKEINFKEILTNRIQIINEDPRHNEEKEMATKIFENLFQN